MKSIAYFMARVKAKITGNDEAYAKLFRRQGMKIGKNSHIYSNIITSESFLIEIGDNVTISSEVVFVTHDNSIIKINPKMPNLFGKIRVGNNCFLGQRSTLMYGVTLADNIIVATGSVVTHSFDRERIIIGGNPARVIGTWDDFYEKSKDMARGRRDIRKVLEAHPELLVQRKSKG